MVNVIFSSLIYWYGVICIWCIFLNTFLVVRSHITALREGESTFLTHVGLQAGMVVHMSFQMVFLCKTLGT